jgi:hypothetical protein
MSRAAISTLLSSSLLGGSLYEVELGVLRLALFCSSNSVHLRGFFSAPTGTDMPIYRPSQKDRSAVLAFYEELEHWLSRSSPARQEDAVLNSEIVLQLLKDRSSLVGNISGLTSQMHIWSETLPQPIEFYHPRSASRTPASAASVANRGTGLLLAFRPRKAVLHSEGVVFEADVKGLVDERENGPGPHNSIANESSSHCVHRSSRKKTRYKRRLTPSFLFTI